jgi:hypothetical protein
MMLQYVFKEPVMLSTLAAAYGMMLQYVFKEPVMLSAPLLDLRTKSDRPNMWLHVIHLLYPP